MTRNTASKWWAPALTLTERAITRRGTVATDLPPFGTAPDNARPNRRFERWTQQRPFDRPEFLVRRLRLDALSESEFASLLATPVDAFTTDDPATPPWVAVVEESNAIGRRIADLTLGNGNGTTAPGQRDINGVELARALIEPFVATALARLFARAVSLRDEHGDVPFEPDRATQLFESALWNQLINRSLRVVILELNVARLQGELTGDTPEARYGDFARRLRTTDLRERILEEYPVLARSTVNAVNHWTEYAEEFLEHLICDAAELSATFADGTPLGLLSELTIGAGDGHRHGRSVIIVGFSSGTRVVYKPRSLAADALFDQLVNWLNERGQSPPLQAIRTIDRGTHGWASYVASRSCHEPAQINRFYERFGSYLALLYALEATDFHYENVIASGEHPMLVDLEALFHPRLAAPSRPDDPEWIGWHALEQSVLRAGVLPYRSFGNQDAAGIDLSAVGGGTSQRTPNRLPVLVEPGTDTMHVGRDFVTLPGSANRPTLGDSGVDPRHYVGRIVAGLESTYRLLLAHREELLAPNGPLRAFANAPIRVVLRPTRQYALILTESYHPDVLRDALERDRLLDRLWVAVPFRPELERVARYEHDDLEVGDVPLFTTRPHSRDLFTTHGARLVDYFEQSGLDGAVARISAFSEEDLVRQSWVVSASFTALASARHGNPVASDEPNGSHLPADRCYPSTDACITAAQRVAQRISSLALRERDRTSWLGLTLAHERDWVIQPIASDLYGGALGIAYFLGYLADATSDSGLTAFARDVVHQTVSRLRLLTSPEAQPVDLVPGSIGVFGALGGAVYVLSHLGVLWSDAELLDVADTIAQRVRESVAADEHLDVIAGVAGLIPALGSLERARAGGPAREIMRACADRLVTTAKPHGNGLAWTTKLAATQPLTGVSHGASGIALGLLEAGLTLNDSRYTDVALAALRYERDTFDSLRRNWPDFRILDGNPVADLAPAMWSWCHGAPGIGLARLAALEHVPSTTLAAELETSIESTVAHGFGGNDSLCHGDLGNLELLLRARERGHSGSWEQCLAREAERVVGRVLRGEWRCGIPGAVETPGLMMGLAGIGYGVLRLGAPDRFPSVLSLDAVRRPAVSRGKQ